MCTFLKPTHDKVEIEGHEHENCPINVEQVNYPRKVEVGMSQRHGSPKAPGIEWNFHHSSIVWLFEAEEDRNACWDVFMATYGR